MIRLSRFVPPFLSRWFDKWSHTVKVIRSNQQVMYALALIVTIPLILAINTFFVVDSMGKHMDYELRLKAELAGSIVSAYSSDMLAAPEQLQAKIEEIKTNSLYEAVKTIEVLVPSGEDFRVLSSTTPSRIDEIMPQWHYTFAWHEDESIATLVKQVEDGKEERVWRIVNPLHDEEGGKIGLVDIGVSTANIDAKTADILTRSWIVLLISVVVVLLLIATNAKLFEYELLFHKIQEVDQMKDEFISIASHELKTPVTAARGFLSLVQQQCATAAENTVDHQIQGDVEKAVQCLQRLSDLVSDLLDVSRIEQDRLRLVIQDVDIDEIVTDVVNQMSFQAKEKGLFLLLQKPNQAIPHIQADKTKMWQVLWNLVSNSVKYTMKGRVEVMIEVLPTFVRIRVKDTGIGMTSKERERLFEKFYRVMNRQAKDVVGTGLGLWITKELVQRMNGKIYVDSIEDVGSEFIVEFPISSNKQS